MDDDNASSTMFTIIFTGIVKLNIAGEMFKEWKNNYSTNDQFDKNCTEDMECMDVKLFCNLTDHVCQCAKYFFRNETIRECEYQFPNLTGLENVTGETYISKVEIISTTISLTDVMKEYWPIVGTMVLAVLCLFACTIYACIGNENEEIESRKVRKERKELSIFNY